MNRLRHAWIVIFLAMLLAACGDSTATPLANTPAPTAGSGDALVKAITPAALGGDASMAQDATPDKGAQNIYFTASSDKGAGVFRTPAAGGTAVAVYTGTPFVGPRGIAFSTDGQTLFVTDPGANQVFHLSPNGGTPVALQGSAGTQPQNVHVAGQTVYFTGIEPASKQPAVLSLPLTGAATPTIIAQGAPLVAPDGVTVTQAGVVYVADRGAGGAAIGSVFKVSGKTLTPIVAEARLGEPAGIALAKNDAVLMVSAHQSDTPNDQVLVVDLATLATKTVTKVVGQNQGAGGLHGAPSGSPDSYAWSDYRPGCKAACQLGTQSNGQYNNMVYLVELN